MSPAPVRHSVRPPISSAAIGRPRTSGFRRRTAFFTAHPKPEHDYEPEDLIKVKISGAARQELRRTLYDYGITRATLFPGLDGLGSEIEAAIRHRFVLRPEDLLSDQDQ